LIEEATVKNSWETIQVDGDPMRLYVAQPDGEGPFASVVVIQNQDGVTEFTQEMTRRVATAGYLGIAPELYHREGEPKTAEQVANLKHTRRDTNVIADVNATIHYLRGCADADTGRLGIVGFCMGGRVAFLMASASQSFKAAVDFYGGGVYSTWGERPAPAEFAGAVCCPIQGHFGELDKNPLPAEMRRLDAELTKLGKSHEFFFYAGAPHGFNRKGWDGYRPDADVASWTRTLSFFGQHLGQASAEKAAAAG
jgi:carboxymethylenebutenolidase